MVTIQTTLFMKLISGLKLFIIILDQLMVMRVQYDLKLNVNIPKQSGILVALNHFP